MGFTIPFDESWMAAANTKRPNTVLHVAPAESVIPGLWDAFNGESTYVDTYSTSELVQILRLGDVTVVNRYSGAAWSSSQDKPRRKRKRKPGKRKVFAAYNTRTS